MGPNCFIFAALVFIFGMPLSFSKVGKGKMYPFKKFLLLFSVSLLWLEGEKGRKETEGNRKEMSTVLVGDQLPNVSTVLW